MRIRPLVLTMSVALLTAVMPRVGIAAPNVTHGVVRGDLGPVTGDPFGAARAALESQAPALGVDAAAFRFESVRRSIVGVHVRGREFRGGVPVEGSSLAVHMVGGRVWQVEARPVALPGQPTAVAIPAATATALGLASLGISHPETLPVVERRLVAAGGHLVDAWTVTAFSLDPAVTGTAVVDAATGRLIELHDDRRFVDKTATVFDPNPIVTSHDTTLAEPGLDLGGVDTDLNSPALSAQLRTLALPELNPAALQKGKLRGPWVTVQGPLPFGSRSHYPFNRANPRFEAAMAYAHLDRLQRWIQEIGFTGAAGVNNESQNVYALPVLTYDNSFYQPGNDIMVLGAGGVDDGEDAEVIVHEYGHAIHDAQVPGWGANSQGGAMGEGWGDFLAAAYYARTSGGFQDACVAEWDSTSYSSTTPTCLRRTDGTKHWPEARANEVHDDGEMWSAFLWRLRGLIGGSAQDASFNSIKLVLTSHEFLTTTADFGDAVAALDTAANALGNPGWIPLIHQAAQERGFPLS
jgi:hypothetical protein